MLDCKFCGKDCKSKNSNRNHERLCKQNPNRQDTALWNGKNGNLGKSNQFIKAKLLGEVCSHSEETRKKISESNNRRSKEWRRQNGLKISKTIQKKVKSGEWHTSLAKRMHYQYNGESFHGSWEVAYAKFLDSVGTPWDRNTTTFAYEFDGKTRRYTPDFYLPIEDVYVEIKGYKTEKDAAKWEQFSETLVVLMKEELEDMNVI